MVDGGGEGLLSGTPHLPASMGDPQAALAELNDLERHVLLQKGTEPSFSPGYYHFKKIASVAGTQFCCRLCGALLFAADTQFDSGTGWPSFWDALPHAVNVNALSKECTCGTCGSHLGHRFKHRRTLQGASLPKQQRFCINAVCLRPLSQSSTDIAPSERDDH